MYHSDLPQFEAQWWPVQVETVPGSGEKLTVAVVVRDGSGTASVRQAITPATLNSIFGTAAGKGMQLLVGHTMLDLHAQLKAACHVDKLEMPFGSVYMGRARECVARDLNEVFDIAMRMSTAFSLSQFGIQRHETGDREARAAFAEWADKVREQVLTAEFIERMAHAFNVRLAVSSHRGIRVGFLFQSYVAQLGVLRPGKSSSADVRALKLKLFDLDVLRREQLLPFDRAELLVGFQQPGDNYTRRQHEAMAESWKFIEHEALVRDVGLVRCESASAAAAHLQRVAIAA